MKRLAIGLAIVFACGFGQPPPNAKTNVLGEHVRRELSDIASAFDGVMGYCVIDLTSGETFGALQDEPFPTASSIKLAIIYELFTQVDRGRLKLDEMRPLSPAFKVGGSGVLNELSSPSLSIRDYTTLMVVLSDNTATNVLIDAVTMAAVNDRMAALGLPHTRLRRRMMDREAALRGDENVSTPAELAKLLQIMERGEGLTPPSRDALLGILKKSKDTPLRRGVPANVEVANKPGDLEGVAADAGIVYVRNRPYVLVVMTSYADAGNKGARAIEDASRAVYGYFHKLASGADLGRMIR
jgi:beta-lactamase class A